MANAVFEGERARITIVGPAAKSFVLPTYIPGQWIPKCGPRIRGNRKQAGGITREHVRNANSLPIPVGSTPDPLHQKFQRGRRGWQKLGL